VLVGLVKLSEDLAWAAGLIEGEGCFTLHTGSPYFQLDSTDEDVLQKLHKVFPFATLRGPYQHKTKPQTKPVWRIDAFGTKAIPVMNAVYPYLCSRRKARIDGLIKIYKEKAKSKHHPNWNPGV
jgi:hypothetical protein